MHQDVDVDGERIEVECADRVIARLRPNLWRQSVEVMPVEVRLEVDELLGRVEERLRSEIDRGRAAERSHP